MVATVAKTEGLPRKDANDKNSPADDGMAGAASGWTTGVAALKPAR